MGNLITLLIKSILLMLFIFFATDHLHDYIIGDRKKYDLWSGVFWMILSIQFIV